MDAFDKRHGGPWDRGTADSWYRRGFSPHYFVGGSYTSDRVTDLTPEEVAAYRAGFNHNEEDPDARKDWGE
jgi:hypothetical protein